MDAIELAGAAFRHSTLANHVLRSPDLAVRTRRGLSGVANAHRSIEL